MVPLLLILLACHSTPDGAPTLAAMAALQDEDRAGRWLDAQPEGTFRLDLPSPPERVAIVALHGLDSRGAEWVAPLASLDLPGAAVWYTQWEDHQCPAPAAEQVGRQLDQLLRASPEVERIVLVGHSYGGLIGGILAQEHPFAVPAEVDMVAAPLAPMEKLATLCDYHGLPVAPALPGTTWKQFRTFHAADGAYRDLATDPQLLPLPDLDVIELPAEWAGGRLGHNRSLTWVAQQGGIH